MLQSPSTSSQRQTSPAVKVLAAIGTFVFVVGGLFLVAGLIAPTYLTSIIFGVVWFLIASFLIGRVWKAYPDLKWVTRGTFIVTALAASAAFAWTSLRDDTANDDTSQFQNLPAAQPATGGTQAPGSQPGFQPEGGSGGDDGGGDKPEQPAQDVRELEGEFEMINHGAASGKATIVKLANGERRLVIDDLSVDNGPDLRVYLTPATSGTNVDGNEDLGALKGNRGDQVYEIPKGVDISKHRAVVVWCRAFSVGFATAELKPAS